MFNFELYNTSAFKRILTSVYDLKEIRIFKDEVLNTLCPFFISNKMFKKKTIINMPFNFYYSPNLNKLEQEFFCALCDYSKKHKKNIILKSLIKYKYKDYVSHENNSILELSYEDYDHYFKSLSKNFRQNIRTSYNKLDSNFQLKKIKNLHELKQMYKIMSILYIDKHKMVFQPYSLFEKLFTQRITDFYIYKDMANDVVLASIVVSWDDAICHYSWGVTHPIYYKYSLNTLLVNELIKECYEKEIKYIDFGATPNSDKNLFFFKQKWGCIHHPVYYYYSLQKPTEIDLNQSYLLVRNIYSKLPKLFIRFMMPRVIPWLVS